MRKQYVTITAQFEALHHWPEAPVEVAFLRRSHRHVFHVRASKETATDRQVEFILLKREVEDYIDCNFAENIQTTSCETIANNLMDKFKLSYVGVFEDGENGAEIHNY